jgi:hypothetical protein
MPDGSALGYSGVQRSSGPTLLLGAAATPGGAWRRLTLGFDLNFGGLDVLRHPVIPCRFSNSLLAKQFELAGRSNIANQFALASVRIAVYRTRNRLDSAEQGPLRV